MAFTYICHNLRERIGFWMLRRLPCPIDLMTCGRPNHYWRSDRYDAADCPMCRAIDYIQRLQTELHQGRIK